MKRRFVELYKCNRRFALWCIVPLVAIFAAILVVFYFFDIRVNFTPSADKGFYRNIQKTPNRGDWVFIRVPDNEFFRMVREREYLQHDILLKQVAAVPGDHVEVTDKGIVINGKLWPQSKISPYDSAGRPVKSIARSEIVADGHIWVLSDHHKMSLDSRYFGAVSIANIDGVAVPILTW
jgi:conjugative transfer signal peptidase TraF